MSDPKLKSSSEEETRPIDPGPELLMPGPFPKKRNRTVRILKRVGLVLLGLLELLLQAKKTKGQ